jgi:hypothetical protein
MAVVWASPRPPPGVPPPLSWSSPFPFVSLPASCRYRSTCHPPHGQLLVGLGVGGVSFVALGGAGPVSVVGVVLAVIVDPPLPIIVHIPLFHLPVIVIVPSTIHPMGSCLWGWGGWYVIHCLGWCWAGFCCLVWC